MSSRNIDLNDPVDVVPAEVGISVGRQDLEHAVLHAQDGDVERAAAEVVDRDEAVAASPEAVGERGRRRLVDDADHVEPAMRPASRVACRWLSLK